MKPIALALLALLISALISAPAYATDFAQAGDKNSGFYIVLTKEPCPDDMLVAAAKSGQREQFRLAKERFHGRSIRACWALNPPVVMIFDEDGDQGVMPISAFRPVQGV